MHGVRNLFPKRWLSLIAFLMWFVWTGTLALPGTAAGGDDSAYAVAVDASGNIYVTGNSWNGTDHDYVLIKYDNYLRWVWGRRYNGPGHGNDFAKLLAVDPTGNVYVSGYSEGTGTGYDYVTIKYDSDGNWLWGRRYTGPGNRPDYVIALALDDAGNVHLTGQSNSGVSTDYVTIKYDSNGNWLWGRRYNGPANGDDMSIDLAMDASGNVIVTGRSFNGSDFDYVTIKYGAYDGAWVWGRRYNGIGNGHDAPAAIGVDGSGFVTVTGESRGAGPDQDYVTIKYDYDGNWLWGRRYNGLGNGDDAPTAMSVDTGGTVFVTGASEGVDTKKDYVTIKYNQAGSWLWGRRYDGGAGLWDMPHALVVDAGGEVYVTGQSDHTSTFDRDYLTVKYDNSGTFVWAELFDGYQNQPDFAYALALDEGGYLVVTGQAQGNFTGYDFVTLKYDLRIGGPIWYGARYDAPY